MANKRRDLRRKGSPRAALRERGRFNGGRLVTKLHLVVCCAALVFSSDCSLAQTQFTIATVKTNLATGFWDMLVNEFEHDGKCNLEYTAEQQHLYDVARDPKKHVDLVFTHTRQEGF